MADSNKEANGVMQKARQAPGFVDFVHLHNHTHYSLLDGLQKIPGLIDRVEAMGQQAVAITDHGTLSGAIEFYKSCTERGIKPIIGIETYVAPRSYKDKNSAEDRNPFHLILLAKNNIGYQNLMKLSTIANLDGFYYKPRIDHELLEKYHEGLICLSGCIGGEVGTYILNDEYDRAVETAKLYKQIMGSDNYYLEMQPHTEWEPQQKVNTALRQISKELNIPLVVTGDAHYTLADDHYPHDILLCVQTGSTVEDPNRMKLEQDLSVNDGESFMAKFKDTPEAIYNTVKIAKMCNISIEMGKILIPKFDVPEGETEKSYLRKLVFRGAANRYTDTPKEDLPGLSEGQVKAKLPAEVLERIDFELGVIGDMGYEGYMLIVADLINWSKNQGIVCGPGRGSAAGSIIAYVTNITELDPLKYDLLFERFLNPDRISMPDIDMDYADDRREEVIQYATEKYGQERVAQIITFGIMAARNAVRDTGRVLGMPYGEVDAIAKLIPAPIQGRHIPLAKSIVDNAELKKEYDSNPRAKELIDVAVRLEGTIRNAGTHAAGVVIAPENLVEYVPLTRASKGGVATQYTMFPIEDLGLLKFDFLGLSNLTIIKNALRIIRKVYDKEIDVTEIPVDDPKTFELLSSGDTTGVFQLESAGMKRYLKELKPTVFEDIIAMVALYRPGPMQWIDDFINRKHNPELVQFDHPKMENALSNTYGVIVYQEQVMQLAKDLSGFTGGQADTLRKGIGKKIPEVLAKMKKDFIEGAIKTSNVDRQFVEKLWRSLEDFAAYCFNKCHSACYALIAVQTAWLKAHYPVAFMAALLTSDHENLDRIAIEVAECRKMGIEVLPPDVNESFSEFAVVPESENIRFGLGAVKNVGLGPVEKILEARSKDGKFKSLEDFCQRVDATVINKKVMESLIKCGAFDSMGDRDTMLHNVDKIITYAARAQKNALSGQIDIFGALNMHEEVPPLHLDTPTEKADSRQHLMWERELLGLYLSSHPLDDYKNYLLTKTASMAEFTKNDDGKVVTVGGIITSLRKIFTRNNDPMAFLQLETLAGDVEVIVFPRTFEKAQALLVPDNVVEITGKINARGRDGKSTEELKVMADKFKLIDHEIAKKIPAPAEKPEEIEKAKTSPQYGSVEIRLRSSSDTEQLLKIKGIIDKFPGTTPVVLYFENSQQKLKLNQGIDALGDFFTELYKVVESENVVPIEKQAAVAS
ncbi:DNA polymerase III subunit alpha [Candidatus Saccharibacteria bacterium]|nr:DNA polymerase III subunit alpha [Candidatus Saccharibacteria bacterium]